MRALLCGVRGSMPAVGADFVEFGGDTSCLALPAADGRWLVLDAGSGLTRLAEQLGDAPLRASIVLTHLHWDHTHGLPFLANADRPDAEVDVWVPVPRCGDPVALLARAMSPPHFPIGPSELRGRWRFCSFEPGMRMIEGFVVTADDVRHKGGRTFGIRVDADRSSLAYVPDHAPRLADDLETERAVDLIEGVDVLLHGGGYLASERAVADAFGHATIDDAIELAETAGVGRLVLVHHSPTRTDCDLNAIERAVTSRSSQMRVDIARQRDWITASGPPRSE